LMRRNCLSGPSSRQTTEATAARGADGWLVEDEDDEAEGGPRGMLAVVKRAAVGTGPAAKGPIAAVRVVAAAVAAVVVVAVGRCGRQVPER